MQALGPLNKRCVGIDISETVLDHQANMPANVELKIADATNLFLLEDNTFDVAFSTQLVEHVHPEDVQRHFDEIARVLRPGGRYICETPHPFTGPHDVSFHYDDVATCFHLKEYTFGEILTLMRHAGFTRYQAPVFRQAMYERRPWLARMGEVPAQWRRVSELLIQHLPSGPRRKMAHVMRLNTVFVEAWL
jgi:SAM-dependent methyltransferase